MRLTQKIPPTKEPFTLEEAKLFLRIVSDQENSHLLHLLSSARAYVEDVTGRALLKQQWLLEIKPPYPPHSPLVKRQGRHVEMRLPRPPLIEVVSIETKDKSIAYNLEENKVILPSTVWDQNLSILYWAGYGEESETLPPTLKQALLMVMAAFYEHQKVDSTLLSPFRVHHLI